MNNTHPYDNLWRRTWGSISAVLKKKYPIYEFRGENIGIEDRTIKLSIWINNNCINTFQVKETDLDIDETFVDRFELLLNKKDIWQQEKK